MRELKYIATSIIASIWIVFIFWVGGLEIFERGHEMGFVMAVVTAANVAIFGGYINNKN